MKSLQTIQKTFWVFQILTKIAFVFSIVGAAICAVGVLCAAVWYNGGQVFSLFGEPVTIFSSGEGLNQALAVLLSDMVLLTADAILLGFAGGYFKSRAGRWHAIYGKRRESSQEAGYPLYLDAHRGCCDRFRHYCLPGCGEKR